jgi:hypothetical protein
MVLEKGGIDHLGPVVWEMKKYYIESSRKNNLQKQKEGRLMGLDKLA